MNLDSARAFKQKLIHHIKNNDQLHFDVTLHHKGHFVELPNLGDFNHELEEWIAYTGLAEYLVDRDIYYCYSGFIYLENEEVTISVQFKGPYDQEFEDTQIIISEVHLIPLYGEQDFTNRFANYNPDNLVIDFEYEPNCGYTYFNLNYYQNDILIEQHELFNEEQTNKLKTICNTIIQDNIPVLNAFPNVKQNWEVSCEENLLHYTVTTDPVKLLYDDITRELY